MGRFDFVSPGAAITDSLTRTLAERKARERQNLLDTLATNADNRAADQAQREDEWRKAQSDNMQRDDELKQVGMIGNMLMPGDDPEALGMDPKLIDLGKKWAQFKQIPVEPAIPAIPGQNGPATPAKTRLGFIGNPKQREELRQQQDDQTAVKNLLANPKTAEIGQKLQTLIQINHGKLPANTTDLFKDDTKPVFVFNHATKQITGLDGRSITGNIPTNAIIEQLPVPPQGPAPERDNWINTGEVDADGHSIFMGSVSGKTKVVTAGTKPQTNNETSLGIPSDIRNTHQFAAKQLTPVTHFMGGNTSIHPFGVNEDVDPTALSAFRLSGTSVIGAAKVTPKVRDKARLFLKDPNAYMQWHNDIGVNGTDLTPREISELGALIDQVAGPDQIKLLAKHPIK